MSPFDKRALEYRGSLDYRAIRARISIRQVLALVSYEPTSQRGPQWRGACPICQAGLTPAREHRFSVHVDRSIFGCSAEFVGKTPVDGWLPLPRCVF